MFICIPMLSALSSHNSLWAPHGGPRYISTTRLCSGTGVQMVYKESGICASEQRIWKKKKRKHVKKNMNTIVHGCALPTNESGCTFQPSTNHLDQSSLDYHKHRCSQPLNTDRLSNLAGTTSLPVNIQLAATILPKMKAWLDFAIFMCFHRTYSSYEWMVQSSPGVWALAHPNPTTGTVAFETHLVCSRLL